ncbi:hypothetical protein TH63_01355 [Rufibacter radiotolerans]|uniref:SHSP domain-containing protein n=1 Tax=Rufibacter radiotolerans TaxID=1379910 RepID=A0A0H4VNB1_9BACT|nr:hypothetical protein TH63_01355 [Rufibacter radiotolerans]
MKGRTQTLPPVLNGLFQSNLNSQGQGFTPAVDLWETQAGYELEIALPGLKKEELSVEFQEGVLTISGKRAFEKGDQERKYLRVENLYGTFKRSFKLPEHIDAAAIEAQLENGVLHVSVPKLEEMVMKRQIAVK